MQRTVIHIEGLGSSDGIAPLGRRLSAIGGVAGCRELPAMQAVVVVHDPRRASVELLLWVINKTHRRASIMQPSARLAPARFTGVAVLLATALVPLCHFIGVTRWLEALIVLAAGLAACQLLTRHQR